MENGSISARRLRWLRRLMAIAMGCSLGLPLGLGVYTFIYGKGYSYLQDNPTACINCHIMNDQYSSWTNSSHRHVTSCNSCHAAGNVFEKYKTKAVNGWAHSWAFTTGRFHEPIKIKKVNREKVAQACLGCHSPMIKISGLAAHADATEASCLRCHADVGHQRR